MDEIRQFWLEKSAAFEPENHWLSDHPAYKLEITVNGDRGTLHFECHYVDFETEEVVAATAADFDVARIDGKWLITNMVGGTTDPGRLSPWPSEQDERRGVARERRRLSRIDDPLVRAVARLPAKVRTKLLIAFVGTVLLLVAVGLLGQRVLGQSNDRVASLGPLQERAVRLRPAPGRRPSTSAALLAAERGGGLLQGLAGGRARRHAGRLARRAT